MKGQKKIPTFKPTAIRSVTTLCEKNGENGNVRKAAIAQVAVNKAKRKKS